MQLLWFSPLPPAQTDIANYTARIAPHFASAGNCRAIVLGSQEEKKFLSGDHEVIKNELNNADFCVYNIGNNARFHGDILALSLEHPGIVVLHDLAINELVLGQSRAIEGPAGGHLDSYRKAMAEWYGRPGMRAAQQVIQGVSRPDEMASSFPLFEVALSNALGVVCHNPAVEREIAHRFPRLPVLTLPLPYPSDRQLRARCSMQRQEMPIRLCAFGFLGRNRRIVEFIQVWAGLADKHRFTLDLAGEVDDIGGIMALAEGLGLGEAVHWHGFLPEDALDDLITGSDLVLNLRFPSMGEASGSQLRIWADGVASAVTHTGWYSQLPDDSVIKIRPEAEAEDLTTLLQALAVGSIPLDQIALRGRELLRAHDPGRYTETLLDWLARERTAMVRTWTETALLSAVAGAVAECTPPHMAAALPASLLSFGQVGA